MSPLTRIVLDELTLRHAHGHYHLRLRSQDFKAEVITDANLGHIMSAFSMALKELHAQRSGETTTRVTQMVTGTIPLNAWTIDDCGIAPYWWTMTMRAGRFSYTVRMDRDLEHVILAFQGAMKFFGFKFGLTTLDPETVRNRDRAGEAGLLTAEDFPA